MINTRMVAGVAAGLCLLAGLPALASTPSLVSLMGTVPDWVSSSPVLGAAPAADIEFDVVLNYRDAAGLASVDAAVSQPGNPLFRHFLTTADFNARYSPTPADVAKVSSWLRAGGVTAVLPTSSRVVVRALAPLSTVGRLLHTSFSMVSVNGVARRAPMSDPRIPARLSSLIAGIDGLDSLQDTPKNSAPGANYDNPHCSKYWHQQKVSAPKFDGQELYTQLCGYAPKLLRKAYGLTAIGETGKGVTVGVVDSYADANYISDLTRWSKDQGLPVPKAGQVSESLLADLGAMTPDANTPIGSLDTANWALEETLDIEAVHAFAPDADIVYYGDPVNVSPDAGTRLALLDAVEEGRASVITDSWDNDGQRPGAGNLAEIDAATSQAQAKGISVLFAAGDAGDEVMEDGSRDPDYPAADAAVTAVGGTTLEATADGTYLREIPFGNEYYAEEGDGWNLSKMVEYEGGGGGNSRYIAEPSYQKGVVPNDLATFGNRRAGRVTPDVSLVADFYGGMTIGATVTYVNGTKGFGEFGYGGTSLSSPLFAGMVADAIQGDSDKPFGLLNPVLYSKQAAGAFRDITATDGPVAVDIPQYASYLDNTSKISLRLVTLGNTQTLHALKGYDDSTGLGSPIIGKLIAALSGAK